MSATASPLPPLAMNGPENSEEVVAAVVRYKQTHTPEQTENVVRRWYEEYDEQLASAIQGTAEIKALRQSSVQHGSEFCREGQDYEKCQKRQMSEIRGAQQDEQEIKRNNDRVVRIQHAFMNMRNGLSRAGLRYEWFKVRTTNNIDRF